MAEDIKKPEDADVSTEDISLDGKGETLSPEQIKALQDKTTTLEANQTKWEQEKAMMNMELEKAKKITEPEPKSEEVKRLTNAEMEKLQFDNFSAYQAEVDLRATETAKAEILKDPEIAGLLKRTKRYDELSTQYATAAEVIAKMGRNGEETLKIHEKDIRERVDKTPGLSITEAVIQVMAEKGELTPGYNPADHGVDGVGGGAVRADESIDDFIKEAYLRGGIKEKYGTSLEDYAKNMKETQKRIDERG